MESIILSPVPKSKNTGHERELKEEDYSLIRYINFILELIIINTLQYNKLTSSEEIFEKLVADSISSSDAGIDIVTIENICQELCSNNGVLIKLKKNNICFYKLNHKNYM
jgi:hypothetical protein